MFPAQAKVFGTPFMELVETGDYGCSIVSPRWINIDFFAALLGGDAKLGHSVVYVQSEMQFYFHDCADKIYKHTTEDKLGNLLRALFIRCAEELPHSVHKLNLFLEFRSDKTIRSIVHRAKSILATDDSFFATDSKRIRTEGPELYERVARAFVEQVMERQAGEVVTVNDAYVHFCEYLKDKSLPPVKRKQFKSLLRPAVQEQFDLGIRNDLQDQAAGRWHCGWKGIRILTPTVTNLNN
jgi:hypothetical protein